MQGQFDRFKDAPWFIQDKKHLDIIVGGAGGIGSWLTLLLTRAGFNPVVYDFDIYEPHNMGGQLCKTTDIGKSKVSSLAEVVKEFSDVHLITMPRLYNEEALVAPIMFSGFDNMKARRIMFENWVKENKDVPDAIFIDGRLTMEQLQIFCVTSDKPGNIDKYLSEHLPDDNAVDDTPCTLKQTSHSAAMIAAHMVGFFTNHITNANLGKEERSVPFFWEYFIPVDFNTVEI